MTEINVEKIMREIRADMAAEEARTEPGFEEIAVDGIDLSQIGESAADCLALERNLAAMTVGWQVNFFRPIPGNRIKVFCKRVVRKLIRFCVEPIALEASHFNRMVQSSMADLRILVVELFGLNRRREEELAELRREVAELRQRLENMEKRDA